MSRCRHGVIVLSDSDIKVDQSYLQQVVAALDEPGVGLVTCLYRGASGAGFLSRLAAMAINHHFLPNVVVGLGLGLARPCFGSTIALKAETLDRIGGFGLFANQLADDYAIGEAVRGLGLRVAAPPLIVDHICSEQTWRELVHREVALGTHHSSHRSRGPRRLDRDPSAALCARRGRARTDSALSGWG